MQKITVSVKKQKKECDPMSLFSSPVADYNRRRPKRGISLLLSIFVQEFFHIAGINALFVLCSVPIVTMPAAYAAMTRVNGFYAQELSCRPWPEFFRVFREEFRRVTPVGLVLLLMPFGLSLVVFELITNLWNVFSYLLLTACSVTAALLILIRYYFFPLMTWTRLSLRDALRNSFLLAIVRLGPNLLMLAFHMVLYCAVMYYFPMSTPYLALCVFGSVNLCATFTAWSGIRKHVLAPEDLPEE